MQQQHTAFRPSGPLGRMHARSWGAWPPGRRPSLHPTLALSQQRSRSRPAAAAAAAAAAQPRRCSSASAWQLRAAASDSQPATPPGDPAAEAAACLAAAGVDLAQLAVEQPEAAAQLAADPALARLLVAAVQAREGLSANKSLTPADLAARLVFLVAEAGLPAAEVQRVYLRRSASLCFAPETARAALAWLRAHFPDPARLQRMGIHYPDLWSTSLAVMEASKAALQQVLSLSDAAWADAVYSSPALLSTKLDTARGVADWLRSPAVGMGEADVLRLFQRKPGLFRHSPGSLAAKLEWLLGRLELPRSKAATLVFQSSPSLTISERLLESRVAALEAYGFTAAEIGTNALHSSLLLTCDFEEKIRPALAELEQLLGPFASPEQARRAVIRVTMKGGRLLTKSPASLRRNIDFLLAQGLSHAEAQGLLREAPQVFAHQLDGAAMAAKLCYYDEVLGHSVLDMLLLHRNYLKAGLEKVDRRVLCMERRGELHLLREGLGWTQLSLPAFLKRYGISEEEWAACEAAWPASERAQRYGLAGRQERRGFKVDFSLVSTRTRAANERRSREANERRSAKNP